MVPRPLLRAENSWTDPQDAFDDFPEIDGTSAAVRRLKFEMACVARDADVTVLITGESGTGKERVARAIHRASRRSAAPFVVVDCAGLSPTLAEDSLFGHVRGAFTGALEERSGPFERAQGGTVFLDEIGDIATGLQMKLLRALQSRVVLRLGSTRETAFDARIIAATNVDLDAARGRGRFRDDLYYRLSVFEIVVPPLRRRGAVDIQAITATALARLAERRKIPVPRVDPAAMDVLIAHPWPGNVRELENTLERMVVAAAGGPILSERHFQERFAAGRREESIRVVLPSREQVVEALEEGEFIRRRAAAALRLTRHQLYRLVRRYGIETPRRSS